MKRVTEVSNVEKILHGAYAHRFYSVRFNHIFQCPVCDCELVVIVRHDGDTRTFHCQVCASIFQIIERAA